MSKPKVVPSCPDCGFSVFKTERVATQVWDAQWQMWDKQSFSDGTFTCSHCGMTGATAQLVMRESTP
jgi:ribosomal protein L37AE/L43A